MKRRLIITADDYGMCPSVNQAIDQCLEAGSVSATCVMINMPAQQAAVRLRKRFPDSSIGIHWNLTQGGPVLEPTVLPELTRSDGSFRASFEFRRNWLRARIDSIQIIKELKAQYNSFSERLGKPEFWNTRQNIHVLPGLFQLFVSLGKELGIPAMRCHRRITIPRKTSSGFHNLTHPLYWLKGEIIAQWAAKAERVGVLMPEARLYTPGYNGNHIAALEEILTRLPWHKIKGAVEIVVHPAITADDALFGSLTNSRLLEYSDLKDPEMPRQLSRSGIDIVNFRALRASN